MVRRVSRLHVALILNAGIVFIAGPSALAELVAGPNIIPPPESVIDDPPGATNTHQQAFNERQNVVLPRDIQVDGRVIPAGTMVGSHMIFLNTPDEALATDIDVLWTFRDPIVAIMSDPDGELEAATNDILGAPGTTYPGSFPGRGMDGEDSYSILPDGNSIVVSMLVREPGDWIRVVTSPVSVCGASGPNLVTNGSFEVGTINPDPPNPNFPYFETLGVGGTNILGWVVAAGTVDYNTSLWKLAAEGERFLDIDGTSPGTLTQALTTVPGQAYEVTFDISGNPDGPPITKFLEVCVGEECTTFTHQVPFGDDLFCSVVHGIDPIWSERSFRFIASDPTTILTFSSLTSHENCEDHAACNRPCGAFGALIDNVSVSPVCGGSVFLTGHDPDHHSTDLSCCNPAGARSINRAAIGFVMDPAFNPFVATGIRKFLFVQSNIIPPDGHLNGLDGILASGFVLGADFEQHDASTLNRALDALGTEYAAIVVASDYGGILTQAELDILNARTRDIGEFLSAGGGIYAMAESNSRAELTPNGGHFGYLPFVVSTAPLNQEAFGYTLTGFGTSLGLTAADVNGNASHSIFTDTSGLTVVDVDQFGNIITLAGRGISGDATVMTVPGTSNPWLAGMPDGTISPAPEGAIGDVAPAQSPVLVPLDGARYVEVRHVTGQVAHGPTQMLVGADGNYDEDFWVHESEHGKSGLTAPIDSLLGVFLDDEIPSGQPPAALDFTSSGSRNYEVLSPTVFQVFFLGDGRTTTNAQQGVIIPPGATRFFVGTMDGFEWNNNRGSFNVTMRFPGASQIPPTLAIAPQDALHSSGYQYGPFTQGSRTYRLTNIGNDSLNWSAGVGGAYFALSETGGTLGPGQQRLVTVSVDQGAAGGLPSPHVEEDVLTFTNVTNGRGDTTRALRLEVLPTQPEDDERTEGLLVTIDHLWQWDEAGGRFAHPGELGQKGVIIDPTKPTYLLTHGWDGTLDGIGHGTPCREPSYAMSSIACAIRQVDPEVNILAWDWMELANPNGKCDFVDELMDGFSELALEAFVAFVVSGPKGAILSAMKSGTKLTARIAYDAYRAGDARVEEEGNKLGLALADVIQSEGAIGSELHLIGKSHGGGVLAQAATIMAREGVPPDSLTTLDTPKIGCVGGYCLFRGRGCIRERCLINTQRYINPGSVRVGGRTAVLYYPKKRSGGFGQPVSGMDERLTNLELNPDLTPSFSLADPWNPQWIDHLWIAGLDEGVCRSDDGWYPQGVRSSEVRFDGGLPLESILSVFDYPSGCFAEQGMFEFSSMACEAVAAAGEPTIEHGSIFSLIAYEPFATAASWSGNLVQLIVDPFDPDNRVILMEEQGDASFFKDIEWPEDALEMTFEYVFGGTRGRENLTVYVGAEIGYYDNAQISLATEGMTRTGPIAVDHVAGTTAQLNFVFRTDEPEGGEFGGELLIDNIRVFAIRPGDVDLDGARDLLDVSVFLNCYGRGVKEGDELPPECWTFDMDGNGVIELLDWGGDPDEDVTGLVDLLDGPWLTPIP